ncbi:hypothetical protein BKI52_20055 [marine bacterium AO1-C]|nr:hypothetical protein BKI52_20055 [marine bacterium AO1-C]
MKENKSNSIWFIWAAITVAAPFTLAIALWNKLPAKIPVHWNIHGEADSFVPKVWAVVIFTLINLSLYGLLWLKNIDPKKNFGQFKTAFRWITFSIATLMSLIACLTFLNSAGLAFNLFKAILTLILLMLMMVGNFMGKLRPNYFVGIRTPWTIESEEVWIKTHRLGGRLWVLGSLSVLILLYTTGLPFWMLFTLLLTALLLPALYSYILYKQIQDNQ